MKSNNNQNSLLSAIFLIAGTSIGAGMLTIPLLTSIAGFIPGVIINIICWLFMFITGTLFLEATLWMHDGSNVLSICNHFLGKTGKLIGGALFIFLYYCILVAYFAGGTPLLISLLKIHFNISLPQILEYPLIGIIIGIIIFFGTKATSKINFMLTFAMFISFIVLILTGSSQVTTEKLITQNWKATIMAAPVLFGAFGYHNIIPTLSTYLKRDSKRLRKAIFWGTFIPFTIYTIWQWLIIGATSPENIAAARLSGESAAIALKSISSKPWILLVGKYFSIFAITTSLLGVSLSMIDFFGDGLKINNRTNLKRAFLIAITIIPPLIITCFYPNIFLKAFSIAGGIGEAILNGLIPILLFWIGFYKYNLTPSNKIFGGKATLILLISFTLTIIGYEFYYLIYC